MNAICYGCIRSGRYGWRRVVRILVMIFGMTNSTLIGQKSMAVLAVNFLGIRVM
jgi:hypothetical protein